MVVKEQEMGQRSAAPRIKDMDAADTPREKAEKFGCQSLSVADLWALVLRTGTVGNPITHLCRELMRSCDGKLTRLERRSRKELLQIKGLGKLKVIQIEAVLELIRRYNSESPAQNPMIKGAPDIFRVMRPHLGHLDHEEVWALIMNQRLEVVKLYQASKGGVASSIFDVKLIVKEALLENASAIALCHNHPSGNLNPSPQDDQNTRKCQEACRTMDLRLIDHLIITSANDSFYSYHDNGRIL